MFKFINVYGLPGMYTASYLYMEDKYNVRCIPNFLSSGNKMQIMVIKKNILENMTHCKLIYYKRYWANYLFASHILLFLKLLICNLCLIVQMSYL